MKFCEKLINLRKEKGISQEEFGNIIDVSRQSVSKWELGQTKPDVDKIKKICEFYNISFDYLLDDNLNEEKDNKREIIKKNNKLILFLKIVVFVIFAIYVMNCSFKALIFSYILAKNDEDNIESYKYYSHGDDTMLNKVVDKAIFFKNNILYTFSSYTDQELKMIYMKTNWEYISEKERSSYSQETIIKDGNSEVEYYYQQGNSYIEPNPFEIISDEVKAEFNFVNIFNPFKVYEITENKDIIIDKHYDNMKHSKILYYIDITTGYLSKQEEFISEEITRKVIYDNYQINSLKDEDINFSEDIKKSIIDGYEKQRKEIIDNYSEENK